MVGFDRISALPKELKISILSRLDVKDAVRTSALSKSWRYIWTSLPELTICSLRDESAETDIDLRHTEHLLSSLQGPILRFRLLLNFFIAEQSSSLERCLRIISEKGALRTLWVFNTGEPVVQFQLPQFDFLKDLHILDCSVTVTLPHGFKGFKCLKTLNLDDVCISEKDLQLLMDGSRNLTDVRLSLLPVGMEQISLYIDNPLLTELRFRILDFVASVEVISAPCLQEVRITGGSSLDLEEIGICALRFMDSIDYVSSLTLDYNILMGLSLLDVQVGVSPLGKGHFHQLKCLNLSGKFCAMNGMIYNAFCSLLKSMPVIERLEIESWRDSRGYLEPTLYDECKKLDGFCCFDRTLKSVKIFLNTFNFAIGMWVPHLILLNASVLKLMEIKYCSCMEEEVEMMDELHRIKPVSPEAKLIIHPLE